MERCEGRVVSGSWDISRATSEDAAAILAVQYKAYAQEAALYGGVTLPPQVETAEDLRGVLARDVVLKAVADGVVIGSVRGCEGDGTCYVGRLVVRPEQQGRGLGSALLAAIEGAFAHVGRFELFTGHKSLRNLGFYGRRGYAEFRRQRESAAVTLIFLEKFSRCEPLA
jgi:GNAT superfamily N-acetyltransferase